MFDVLKENSLRKINIPIVRVPGTNLIDNYLKKYSIESSINLCNKSKFLDNISMSSYYVPAEDYKLISSGFEKGELWSFLSPMNSGFYFSLGLYLGSHSVDFKKNIDFWVDLYNAKLLTVINSEENNDYIDLFLLRLRIFP